MTDMRRLAAACVSIAIVLEASAALAQFSGGGSFSGQLSAQQQYNVQFGAPSVQPVFPPPPRPGGVGVTLLMHPGAGPQVMAYSGMASGAVAAASMGPGCRGALPAAPQQQVWAALPTSMIDVLVRANGPVSLAIRAPNGAFFCTDSLNGAEARITMRGAIAGPYLVYVGSPGAPLAYTIAAGHSAPINAASIPLPAVAAQPAPWTQPASNSQATVAAQPPVMAQSTGSAPSGGSDLVLQNTLPNAAASNSVPVGWVRVEGGAGASAPRANTATAPVIAADTIAGNAPGARSARTSGTLELSPNGVDTQRANGVVSGRTALRFLGRSCLGFGDRAPSNVFTVRPGVPFMRVFVRSNGDTTMALRAPNGRVVCVDDTFGAHPSADVAQPIAGEWRVFVGSAVPGSTLPYELTVSTRSDARPAE